MPFGELLDYVAIEKIMNEGCKKKLTEKEEEEEFDLFMTYK